MNGRTGKNGQILHAKSCNNSSFIIAISEFINVRHARSDDASAPEKAQKQKHQFYVLMQR